MSTTSSRMLARPGAARPAAAPPPVPPIGVRTRVPMHPGAFLERHYLKPLGLTQSETARLLGVSRRRVHELVHGQRAMSADTALRCAQRFGMPAAEWLAMQGDWDAWSAWQVMRHELSQVSSAGDAPGAPVGAAGL